MCGGWGGGGGAGRGGSCRLSLKLELDTRAPCLPRFILLISFSDTLLVVSIVTTFVVQKGLLIVPVGTRALFNLGSTLLRLCVCVSGRRESFGLSLKSGARHARALSSEVSPVGELPRHISCGFDFRHSQ